MKAPVKAQMPPVMCTTPEPAKSTMPADGAGRGEWRGGGIVCGRGGRGAPVSIGSLLKAERKPCLSHTLRPEKKG